MGKKCKFEKCSGIRNSTKKFRKSKIVYELLKMFVIQKNEHFLILMNISMSIFNTDEQLFVFDEHFLTLMNTIYIQEHF